MNIALLAHTAEAQCTLNGQPIDCSELAQKAEPFLGLAVGLLIVVGIVLIVSFVFWLLMLIHAIQHNSPERTVWIVILLASFITGFSLIGAIVYYFAEKKKAEAATVPTDKNSPPPTPPAQAKT